jgi:predicted ATPase
MTSPSPFLKSITLEGFLSFGPEAVTIPLTPLNVLIGPNGSGKSNLVEAFSVLRALPKDLSLPIRQGGGIKDWLWWRKGSEEGSPVARLEVVFSKGRVSKFSKGPAIRYSLVFGARGDSIMVLDERAENESPEEKGLKPDSYFGYERGRLFLNSRQERREIQTADLDPAQSILSQLREPKAYPELTRIADRLRQILIYRNWQFGPDSSVRRSCRADVRTDTFSESFDNLPARLAVLMGTPVIKRRLLELLRDLAPGFEDLVVIPEGGALQLYLTEGSRSVPAHRLSDGTLRYLCLLAILLDPGPAPLVIIEEPELGLHPDVLPTLRDLMVEASEKTQLIVTTHSTQMVDTMTDYADSVLVCEKKEGPTVVTRLTQDEVDRWREHGGLGSLWMSGHLGGKRW